MKQKVIEFLKQHGGSAPALAIARSLFHLRGGSVASAERLLQKALGDDPRFGRDGLGNWYLLPETGDESERQDLRQAHFCICAMRPDNRLWPQAEELWLGRADVRKQTPGDIVTQSFRRSEAPAEIAAKLDALLGSLRGDSIVVACQPGRLRHALQFWSERAKANLPVFWELHFLHFAQNVLRLPKKPTLESLYEQFHVPVPAGEAALSEHLQAMATLLVHVLQTLPDSIEDMADLLRLAKRPSKAVNFTEFAFSKDHIRDLPEQPGVYVMKNAAGEPVYVGKSGNLRRRLAEYFLYQSENADKLARILSEIQTLEWQTVDTELDALILEARFIRQYRPTANIQQQIFASATPQTEESCRILILLSQLSPDAIVYVLSPSGRFERVVSHQKRKPRKKLLRLIESLCYGEAAGKSPGPEEKQACELAWRWFREHREAINWLDAADFGSAEECLQNLMYFLDDFERVREKQIVRGQ
ncbi:MAG: nucleotide excision repair endonuclease [candidate division KSB1 bacterium]|nr:nucleotide excision repair endonuclease [candidate division KSB1 bacterium]